MNASEVTPSAEAIWSLNYEHSYSHLYLRDRDADEVLPRIEERNATHQSGESALLVFVREDTEGDVFVEFFLDDFPARILESGRQIFDGILSFQSGVIQLATVGAADDEDQLELSKPGQWRLQVLGMGVPAPHYVAVCLSESL